MLSDARNYKFSYEAAMDLLRSMASCFLSSDQVVYVRFDDGTDDSYAHPVGRMIPNRHNLKYQCFIGIKCMKDHQDVNGRVRNMDLAWCAKHIAHEARHLYRNLHTYQGKMSRDEMDMARMELLSSYFHGYKNSTYAYHPCEIDADRYGLLETASWFDRYLLDDNGEPALDIRSCLFEKLKEQPWNRVWHAGIPVAGFDDAIAALDCLKDYYQYADRGTVLDLFVSDRRILQKLSDYPDRMDLLNAVDRRGVAFDEKLMAVCMDIDTLWIDRHKGMWPEAKRIAELYPGQKPVMERMVDRGVSIINRMDRELYSELSVSEKLIRKAEYIQCMKSDGMDGPGF